MIELTLSAVLVVTVAMFWLVLRPVGLKFPFAQSIWNLPPGPRGIFVLGNLLQFLQVRGNNTLIPYVSPSVKAFWNTH